MAFLSRRLTSDYALIALCGLAFPFFWLLMYAKTGMDGMSMGTDFHAFYNTAVKLAAHDLAIYDRAILSEYLASDAPVNLGWSFPYPPSIGLLIRPLAMFDYAQAFLVWTFAGIAFFTLAQALALKTLLPDLKTSTLYGASLLFAVISPFVMSNIMVGQNGHIFSGLLLLVLFQSRTRPWLAACALGVLSMKPQIAGLAAVLLFLAKDVRTLVRGAIIALVLSAISAAIWGVPLWVDYLDYIRRFSEALSIKPQALQPLTLSVFTTLRLLDIAPSLAGIIYVGVAIGVFASLWRMGKKIPHTESSFAALLAGGMLLLPHVMCYDVVFLNMAVLWLLVQSRNGFLPGERVMLCAILLALPLCVLLFNATLNIGVVFILLLHVLLVRRAVSFRRPS